MYDSYETEYEVVNITPVDVKVYYEDKRPYLDYIGECLAPDNTKIKIHIPKVGLSFHRFYCRRKVDKWHDGTILGFEADVVLESKSEISFQIIEREMTKEQIEKALGYKVKIKE